MSNENQLKQIASNLVRKGKGILAADESNPTCQKRFASIGVESSFDSRNEYRDILFTSDGIEDFISGVILFDETLRQSTTCDKKIPFPELLSSKGITPGIKVDKGTGSLEGFPNEKATDGLDGLDERLAEYYELGARFAKWRAVITIGDDIPSEACIYANAHSLARYASKCQQAGLVPIVEPEVLMDGKHTIETCDITTKKVLKIVFEQLHMYNVLLEGIILKPNMIISAIDCPVQADVEKVADLTYACLKENVPENVPGIAFLSGGQSGDLATLHLNKMNEKYSNMPWNLTFSYGRALQHDALNMWKGEQENRKAAQELLLLRTKNNSLATFGSKS
ncbi:MAG: class I fructose-bisphosphate aldolase [Bacteroidota bacterium]|nr:class I fructose-bisphosphate aldolase [Bacteroidota bacterium]MEC9209853.1 class I fructose-bisphosphate aldolase [Bacteroidota bacterium]